MPKNPEAFESVRADAKLSFGALLTRLLSAGNQAPIDLQGLVTQGPDAIRKWMAGTSIPQTIDDLNTLTDGLKALQTRAQDQDQADVVAQKQASKLELRRLWEAAGGGKKARRPLVPQPLLIPDPDPVLTFIRHRHDSLLAEGLKPGANDDGSRHEHFVNLELHLPRDQNPATRDPNEGRFERLQDLLASNPSVWAWVLLGDPGGGKSTLLFMHELTCAAGCLAAPGQKQELCLRLTLSDYDATVSAEPDAWIDAQIQKQNPSTTAAAPSLKVLDEQFRVRVLLDGLNEIAGTDVQRELAQTRFVKWAFLRAGQLKQPAPVFTVRRLDYQPPAGLSDEGVRLAKVDVRPWREDQIQAYCERHAPGLWPQVDGHAYRAKLLEHLSNPFNLRLQEWLFKQGNGLLAANRGELLGHVGRLRLCHEVRRGTSEALKDKRLLHTADLRLLEMGEPKPLHSLPLQGELLPDLRELALFLHARDANGWALFKPGARDSSYAVDRRFGDCIALAKAVAIITEYDARDRFAHQLWQEYFAAMALGDKSAAAPWPEMTAPEQGPIDPKDWELPSASALPLDACVQLAAQISPDPAPLIAHLTAVNPALASRSLRALGERGNALQAQRQALRERLLQRCTDPSVALPQRVEAGEELGLLGDNIRFVEGYGPGKVRYLLPRNTWQVNGRENKGWIAVPSGKQVLGERNQVMVNIQPGLALAFAPLTNAEFACFVQAGGYGGGQTHNRQSGGRVGRPSIGGAGSLKTLDTSASLRSFVRNGWTVDVKTRKPFASAGTRRRGPRTSWTKFGNPCLTWIRTPGSKSLASVRRHVCGANLSGGTKSVSPMRCSRWSASMPLKRRPIAFG